MKKLERRKRKWFEKFCWFVLSEGFLVLVGKDVSINEVFVKKYMEDNDFYCYVDVYGVLYVVIKDG